jgi:hypothetical protein
MKRIKNLKRSSFQEPILSKESSGSMDLSDGDENDAGSANVLTKRTKNLVFKKYMPKFRKLVDCEYEDPSASAYEPPPKFYFSMKLPEKVEAAQPKIFSQASSRDAFARFQRLDSPVSLNEGLHSQFPMDFNNKSSASKRVGEPQRDDSSGRQEYHPPTFPINTWQGKRCFSDQTKKTFDVRDNNIHSEIEALFNKNAELEDASEAVAKSDEASDEFRQFVFDESFSRIENVTVQKSDPGVSNFVASSVAALTANLTQNIRQKATPMQRNGKKPISGQTTSTTKLSVKELKKSFKDSAFHKRASKIGNSSASNSSSFRPPHSLSKHKTCSVSSNGPPSNASVVSSQTDGNNPFFAKDDATEVDPFDFTSDANHDDVDWDVPLEKSAKTLEKTKTFSSAVAAKFDKTMNKPSKVDKMMIKPSKVAQNVKTSTSMDNNALIQCIRNSVSDVRSTKPDPSPRGAASITSYMARKSHKSSKRKPLLNAGAKVPRNPVKGDGPKGLPNNAILGSMLFRHTSPTLTKRFDDDDDDDEEALLPDVPPAILTAASTESTVSSVTEEATSFYQKNFEGWNKQAYDALNHFHRMRKSDPKRYRAGGRLTSVEEEHRNMFSA